MTVVLGIDTGGTFTDFVLVDQAVGRIATAKVSSTPNDPSIAIAAGLARLEGADRIEHVVIGTTVATNAVIERMGPRMIFITNRGFEDIPFVGRLDKERIYDLNWQKPKPLLRRRDSMGIGGRYDNHGIENEPLSDGELSELKAELVKHSDGEVAVAVCCLFSYLNGGHEKRIAQAVRAALPNAFVSVSHEVSPVWREYERASTALADAFVKPVVTRYIDRVGKALQTRLAARRWNLLASNGGYLLAEQALERPAQLLISGLAGGVIGAGYYAKQSGHDSVFTLDMGGTSCDIGLVLDGNQQYAAEFQIAFGIPASIPCVAVRTIGAGGGSIGWIDKGGLLHVGPRSAGAEPGPAAYGKGGTEPTITDANLVLGRLDPAYFLGGAMKLDRQASVDAVSRLGEQLHLPLERAALAMVSTTDENMANAIRLIAVERGLDARTLALIAIGGAGPLHARGVAERLGIATVIVPPRPGLCSAFGAAIADARVDRVQTLFMRSEDLDLPLLAGTIRRLREGAVDELRRSVDVATPTLRTSVDMRYSGQNYEVEVTVPDGDFTDQRWGELLQRFTATHEHLYGFALLGEPIEIINLRVTATNPESERSFTEASGGVPPPVARRTVYFDAPVDCAIYHRSGLPQGAIITGPAVIEETDSTTLVFPGDEIHVGAGGVLTIKLGATP